MYLMRLQPLKTSLQMILMQFYIMATAKRSFSLQQEIASRSGAIVGITHVEPNESIPLERLVIERAISVNTAAAGGNASLMTMSE